ncbi:hypothetical protein ABZ684_05885 [Streptomyces sp. NPDC006995]|uniref:hypothetical protein n=1 Tax=Streptomyces sp. NPDC006995 TaxID=3156907 RepID=UPI0033E6AA93
MKKNTGLLRVSSVLLTTAVLLGGATSTASAEPTPPPEPLPPCPSTSLCFMHGGELVDEYYHVTPWQYLPIPLPAPLHVVNMRQESAWIGDTKGGARCVEPGETVAIYLGTIEAVRVTDSVECRLT